MTRRQEAIERRDLWHAMRRLAIDSADAAEAFVPLLDSASRVTLESCIAQGLGPALAVRLKTLGAEIPDQLRQEMEAARFARMASIDVLGHLGVALGSAGIPWVALKGAVVGSFYAEPEQRGFKDIDVLVRGSDLGATLEVLDDAGIEDVNRNWANYLRYGVAETPLWALGMPVDLHWHVIPMAKSRVGTTIDIAAMIDRRRKVTIGGTEVSTLDREDLLIHVCIHAALSGATKLQWLLDVRELIRSEQPDWDEFVSRSRDTGLGPKIGQVLDRARHLVRAQVPADVPAELCHRLLLRGRLWLDDNEGGGGLPDRYARGMPVEVSGSSVLSVAEAARQALSKRVGDERGVWNVGDPDGPLYWGLASSGPEERSAYIAYAERWNLEV